MAEDVKLGRLHRSRPWLGRKQAAIPPEERYARALRNRRRMAVGNLVFFPVNVLLIAAGIGRPFGAVFPLVMSGVEARRLRRLRRDPEPFLAHARRLTEHVAAFEASVAAGLWRPPVRTVGSVALFFAAGVLFGLQNALFVQGLVIGWIAVGALMGTIALAADTVMTMRVAPTLAVAPAD